MHAGQQHRLRLLAAHGRRPGDIPATAGHLEVNQARQRVGIDADIHHLHPGPGLRRQHADAGVAPHHIACMNGRHHLRRRGHAFMPDAMVGAHDHNRFLRQRQLPCKPADRPAAPPASPDGQGCRAALTGHQYAAERAPWPPHRAAEWQPVTPKVFPFSSSPLASGLTAAPVKRVIRPAQSPPRGYPRSARRGFASAPIPDPRSAPG